MRVPKHPLGLALASLALLVIGALLLGRGLCPAAWAGGRSDAEVKVQAAGTKPDATGQQVITITLDINKDWHIYANPVGNEDFEQARTLVSVKAAAKPEEVKVHYPPGKVYKDKSLGQFLVYENRVQIQAHLRRAPGDTSPVEVTIRFSACRDKLCLPPATVKRTVP